MNSTQDVGTGAIGPDPLTEFDWGGHWRRLVTAREAQMGGPRPDYWDRVGPNFGVLTRPDDPLLQVMEPYLSPGLTLLDVGAGTGRYAAGVASRLDWVTAVEPSEVMRSRIPALPNLTVVGSSWEDAVVAPADLVLCSHVLYVVAEARPFLEKLGASARRRVFVQLRDTPMAHPATGLWELLTGRRRLREPGLYDAYNLVRQAGVHPDLDTFRQPLRLSFASFDAALDDVRFRVGEAWQEDRGRAWLAEHMEIEADGTATYNGEDTIVGVLHWQPAR